MSNLKLFKPSNLDQYQMDNNSFDAEKSAWRVSIVDGVEVKVDNLQLDLPETVKTEVQVVNVPEIIKQTEIHQVNVPVVVKEIEKVEVPVVVKEVEYKEIQIPVVVQEVKVIEIEKPIIVKETIFKELPLFIKACMAVQALASLGMLISHILKG